LTEAMHKKVVSAQSMSDLETQEEVVYRGKENEVCCVCNMYYLYKGQLPL